MVNILLGRKAARIAGGNPGNKCAGGAVLPSKEQGETSPGAGVLHREASGNSWYFGSGIRVLRLDKIIVI